MEKRLLLFTAVWMFLARMTAFVAAADDTNIAAGKPVTSSHAVAIGQTAASVTDGDIVTFVHPATSRAGYYFQIDLGREYPLQTIELYSRIDCCPERLGRVRMSVFADNGSGAPGVENWGHVLRPTGTNNIQGDADVITAELNPTGVFRGRFIRIASTTAAASTPQVAEIQVFEAPSPDIVGFQPDQGNITKTANPALSAQAVLSWKVGAFTSLSIEPGIGVVAGPEGSVTVSPAVTTTYTLTAANGAGTSTRTVTVGVDETPQPPFLSEFLASNSGGLRNREGNSPDWIEIGNPNVFTLNLAGFYLSDDAKNRVKWRFPSFSVPPGGYAVVFADGRDLAPPLEEPHTNFSLSTAGEDLLLTAPDSAAVLSRFPGGAAAGQSYSPQTANHSYGIVNGVEGFFHPPTPNAPNGPRFDGVTAPVEFSVKRGFYSTPQSVVLTCATPGAEIRYTTNGAAPSATTGQVYTAAIPVETTTVLRAAAWRAGFATAASETHTYIFSAAVKAAAVMNKTVTQNATYGPKLEDGLKDVPSISLTTGPGMTITGADDKVAAMEWITADGAPSFQVFTGVKLFGGAFTNFAKKSYRLSFKGEYGTSKLEFPVFAGNERGPFPVAQSFDQLELRNGSHDMVDRGFYMSNIFSDATMLDLGSFAPQGRFVHVYLNGVYNGLYHLRERWGAAMMADYFGGQKSDYESINGNLNVGGWAVKGTVYDGTGAAWERIRALRGSYKTVRQYVDLPQYIDYMITFMFGDSEDEYRASGPAEAGHGFKFLLNDSDGFLRTSAANRTTRSTPGTQPGDGPGSLFSMLFAEGDPDYRTLLADRIHKACTGNGALTSAQNIARLTAQCAAIERAIIAECARWNYRTPATWNSAKNSILNSWLRSRTATVLGQFKTAGFYPTAVAPAVTVPEGGNAITMTTTTSGGVIYYTLDGSDPRVSGLAPAPLVLGGTGNAEAGVEASKGMKYHIPAGAADGYGPGEIPSLIAWWPFDTSAADAAGGYDGTFTGGAAVVTPGRFGAGALELNGTSQAVTLGSPPGLQINSGGITLSAWVKPDDALGIRNIIHRGHESVAPVSELFLRINAGGYQAGVRTAAGNAFASGPVTGANSARNDLGLWVHLAAVYDGAAWRLYRNGVQLGSFNTGQGPQPVSSAGWSIGSRGDGTARFFDGQIDEVRLYNRGLSPEEVLSLFNNTTAAVIPLWTAPEYDAGAWPALAGAPGFAPDGSGFKPLIGTDVSPVMRGISPGLYLRLPFTLTAADRAALQVLQLHLKTDDGCSVYMNGAPVASRNAPAPLTGDSAAAEAADDEAALKGETLDLAGAIPLLRTGANILAVHGLNISAADDDFLLSAQLNAAVGIPRLGVTATVYSAPLPLTQNTAIRARTYVPATGQWSPVTEVFFQSGSQPCPPGALVISEIYYHPPGEGGGEFLELMNVSPAAVNLRGVSFTQGISFTFPANRDVLLGPGQRLTLTDSVFTFQKIHGWAAPFGGIFAGSLADEGERLTIFSADGAVSLLSFIYGVAAPWPSAAAGAGYSLVLINPRPGIDLANPANWRASRTSNGNPTAADALAFFGNSNMDADGDGLSALMEYALGLSDSSRDAGAAEPVLKLDPLNPFVEISLDHAAAADAAHLRVDASQDLTLWNVPLELTRREMLPDGRQRSTWRAFGNAGRLFLRLHAGE